MMNRWIACGVAALVVLCAAVESAVAESMQKVTVFASGKEGYHTFRIPAIMAAANGDLLAFAEGRKTGGGDAGDIDIVMKRSSNGGATWSALQLVQEEGGDKKITIGNPAPVLDATTGVIWLTFCRNNSRVFVISSSDHGQTWSPRREITEQVKPAGWNWYATGPVHGIQLLRGEHAGRLVIPCDHGYNIDGVHHGSAHVIYSDDHGQTWQVGGVVDEQGDMNPNESSIVELTDGRLYFNIRNQFQTTRARIITYSDDAGQSFAPATYDMKLIDPRVQGSVLRFAARDQGDPFDLLLFSNPASSSKRVAMTVRASVDESATWSDGLLITENPSAYSDLIALKGRLAGVLFETGTKSAYETIQFVRFSVDDLGVTLPAATPKR